MARRILVLVVAATLLAAAPARANPDPVYQYVEVSDGTQIAVSIWFPPAYKEGDGKRWPVLFEMDGYGGARQVNDTQFAGKSKSFIVVYASIRGTGCSGGQFDLFSPLSAQDGYDVIENWIIKQPWSNGRVGITGHSYSGLTGMAVAETAPPHVRGVAVSGLIDDLYRGLLNMGGIPNLGFPVVWGGAARPELELAANGQEQVFADQCRANFIEHQGSDYIVTPTLFLDTYGQPEAAEDSFAVSRGLMRNIARIAAPIQLGHQFQDEQTGPRGGPVLWSRLPSGLPKRFIASNGRHGKPDTNNTRGAWLRCWVIKRGRRCGDVTNPSKRVLIYLDTRKGPDGRPVRGTPYATSDFPAPETRWRREVLEPRSYVSTAGDYHVSGNTGLVFSETQSPGAPTFGSDTPAQARWTVPFDRRTVIAGPAVLTLWASVTAPDTDFFVDVLDRDPKTGELRYLERGMQRASFRTVDEARSEKVTSGRHKGAIWRPYHPFVNPQSVPIGEPQRYEIEIFPFGHVFRPGHELVLQLHAPPPNDPLSIGTYAPATAPATVDVLSDQNHLTSILLPVLPKLPPNWTPATCADVAGELCLVAPA